MHQITVPNLDEDQSIRAAVFGLAGAAVQGVYVIRGRGLLSVNIRFRPRAPIDEESLCRALKEWARPRRCEVFGSATGMCGIDLVVWT